MIHTKSNISYSNAPSLNYITELIHSVSGFDPNIIGMNTKILYDFQCQTCNYNFKIIIPHWIEIFPVKEIMCNSCNNQTAIYRGK